VTETLWILFDLLLAAMLLGLGAAAVGTRDLKRGVVLFIVFGLFMALVWARLRAPDLALAEAAIGAGIAGALLLAALRDEPAAEVPAPARLAVPGWLLTLFTIGLAVVIGWALIDALATAQPQRLLPLVSAEIASSGVSHPVTAVLLNFRAYDTLLELAVVLAAVYGIVALAPARPGFRPAGPVLEGLVGWLVPLLIVTAAYLLWAGAHAPGGAFQAGATLAAAAVLLRLGGHPRAALPPGTWLRLTLVAGVGVFLLVGLAQLAFGRAFLAYPVDLAGGLILLIEAAATLAIAAALAMAYLGGYPSDWHSSASAKQGGKDDAG
jgi:multisubunit Na+/H+ antiporter MnhB subunit